MALDPKTGEVGWLAGNRGVSQLSLDRPTAHGGWHDGGPSLTNDDRPSPDDGRIGLADGHGRGGHLGVASQGAVGSIRSLLGRTRELVLLIDLAVLPCVVREVQCLTIVLTDRIQVLGEAHRNDSDPLGLSIDAQTIEGETTPGEEAK